MKIIKTFKVGEDSEVNKYLDKHRDHLTGSTINVTPESISIILDDDWEKSSRIATLRNKRLECLKRIDESDVESRNRQTFLDKKNIYFAELEAEKRKVGGKKEREQIDKRIAEVGQEKNELRNAIASFDGVKIMAEGDLKVINEIIAEIEDGLR